MATAPQFLTGQFLVAMPNMGDPRFVKSVIYMVSHNNEGAMGLIINKIHDKMRFPDLLKQLGIPATGQLLDWSVHHGGPVETARGFVLHSPDFTSENTMTINDDVSLTATVDVLQAVATDSGPTQGLFALGYAGWGPGQLDQEIQANGWLNMPVKRDILFDRDHESKWQRVLGTMGITPMSLSSQAGHA